MSRPFVAGMMVWLLLASMTWSQQGGLIPASPQLRRDKQGNEWYVEQNGMITRQGGGNSILNGAMLLMIGSEQFYCNQPMSTPDGREMVLVGQQPMSGLMITRHIRFMEKEGGMRYLEIFTNSSATDVSATIELRQNFSGQVKQVLTDTARLTSGGTLEKEESSVVVLPGSGNYNSWLFTVSGPRSALKPRIASQNQYQTSFFYSLVIPAGGKASLLHTVTQAKLPVRPDESDLGRVLKPFALARQIKDLPKGMLVTVANLRAGNAGSTDLAAWFPNEIMGIERTAIDVLALGEGTRLHGRASCAKLVLQHRSGAIEVPWSEVVALSGRRHGMPRVWMKNGQLLQGRMEAEELKFTLASGLQMNLNMDELDRLVMAGTGESGQWPAGVDALVETWQGERLALRDGKASVLTLVTPWGSRSVPLNELAVLTAAAEDENVGMAWLKDGSRLRAWFSGSQPLKVQTVSLGEQEIPVAALRAVITAPSSNAHENDNEASLLTEEEDEPAVPFADLAGDQRLVASMAANALSVVTAGGLVKLQPDAVRELRNVTEDVAGEDKNDDAWFQLELWGGGSVMGQLQESVLTFQVGGQSWLVPTHELARVVNPAPTINEGTLARIGQLVRELGHDDWKIRERATGELKTLGELARGSLKEAFKQTEDAEVKRRIESILGETE